MAVSKPVRELLGKLRDLREQSGLSAQQMDERLLLGSGWTTRFESGEIAPSIDVLLSILQELEVEPSQFLGAIVIDEPVVVARDLYAEQNGKDLDLHFLYGDYDAIYRLKNAKRDEFEEVLRVLRDGLAAGGAAQSESEAVALQSDAVARTFLRAVSIWPDANPSDLWWFLVYRMYVDPFNHPASNARRDLGQSWRRTGGWALEEVLVRHYGPFLESQGIRLSIDHGQRKVDLLNQLTVADRLEPAKVDVLLTGLANKVETCFGVVHVKTSFAERRTDDVPMSRALVEAGYTSPLWTMDSKSFPSAHPVNRGELGVALGEGRDRRSAKRKDIEDDAYFSACFSYNANTVPTRSDQDASARIIVCDFKNPDDAFSAFIVSQWQQFRR